MAPTTPVAAASVGVAMPSMIRPITMKNTNSDGTMRSERHQRAAAGLAIGELSTSMSGARLGFIQTRNST